MPSLISGSWFAPSLQGYRGSWLRGDVVGGLAAGTVVIPQAMAYATIAGVPVEIGLYTCMLPMLVYALLGGSRTLSVSTTSTIAVLVASTIATRPGSAADHLQDVFTLTFLVGVCLLAMRLFRIGGVVENISPATMAGIKAGVGLSVAASQLPALIGFAADPDADGFFSTMGDAFRHADEGNWTTVVVSVVAIVVLYGLRRVAPAVPGPLVAVAGGIVLVALTGVEDHGLALIDKVPTGLPSISHPVLGDLTALLPGALAIAFMAFLETVLVARGQRSRTEPLIDSDQELLAIGAASLAGGFTQALPPAGGFSQSAVNQRSGARTQLAQLVTAALAVLVALFLAPLLDDLPSAVLASMVFVAVIGLVDVNEFRRFAEIDRAELWVAAITAAIGLTAGLLIAVAVGLALTFVLVIRELNTSRVEPDDTRAPVAGVVRMRFIGSVYTGNARATQDAVQAAARALPDLREVVLDGSRITRVTVPLIDLFEALEAELAPDHVALFLTGLSPVVLDALRKSAWFREFETEHVRVG